MNTMVISNRSRTGLAVLCTLIISSMTSSALAAGWSTPVTLGAPNASWQATVGADRKGDAVAAWLQTDTVPYKVYGSIRKAGNLTFTRAAGLSGPSTWNPYPLMARMDQARNSFVVWQDQGTVYGLVKSVTGPWPPAQVIASGATLVDFELDKAGNATMLVSTGAVVQVIDRPAGGSWGPPQTIASHTFSAGSGLAMADDGGAVAIWETFDRVGEYYTNFVLHASRRASWGATWGPTADLSPPLPTHYGHAAVVGMDPRGNAVIVGRQLDNDTNLSLGALTSTADTDTWSVLQLITTAGIQAGYPSVAVDRSGLATLVWADVGSSGVLTATTQLPNNVWTAPTLISEPGVVTGYPLVGTNRAGIAAVSWPTVNINGSASLQVTIRPGSTAAWGMPVTLSTAANGLSNGLTWIDDTGRVLLVWNETPPGWIGQTTKTSTYVP